MARQLRIEYAGAIYHVMSRGDRKEDIFLDDEDRRKNDRNSLLPRFRSYRRGAR
jgi:hypothetical protein